jgi:hypothetical protein
VVYCKLVLLELEGFVADSAIIPLKFQQKVIICGGQSKPIKAVYIGFTGATQKVILATMNNQVFSGKLASTYSARRHLNTPVGRTGAGP